MNGPKLKREHWRITVPVLALFCVGALLSASIIQPTPTPFQNLRVGGVFGGLAGLGIGTYWHLRNGRRRGQTDSLLFLSLYGAGLIFASFALIEVGIVPAPSKFGVHSADTAAAKHFVREAVGVSLPDGARAIYIHEGNKTTFMIEERALDAVEVAIGLDSTWVAEPFRGDINYVKRDSTTGGVHEQLYQRWNRLYQLTRFRSR